MTSRTARNNRRFGKKKSQAITIHKFVSFEVGDHCYGIPIEQVQRIIKDFTSQDQNESGLSLMKYHQNTITLMDLSTLLPGESQGGSYLIICNLDQDNLVGFPVSKMPGILEVSEDQFETVPELYQETELPPGIKQLIYTADDQIVFYLDLKQLLQHR